MRKKQSHIACGQDGRLKFQLPTPQPLPSKKAKKAQAKGGSAITDRKLCEWYGDEEKPRQVQATAACKFCKMWSIDVPVGREATDDDCR